MLVVTRLVIGWHFFREGVSHKNDSHWSSEGFLKQAKGPLAPAYQGMLSDLHGWNALMLGPLTGTHATEAADAGDVAEGEQAEPAAKAATVKEKDAAKETAKEPAKAAPTDAGKKDATKPEASSKDTAKPDAGKKEPAKSDAPKPAAKLKVASESEIYSPWLSAAKRDWKNDADKMAARYDFSPEQKQQADELVNEAETRTDQLLAGFEPDIRMYRELVARADAMHNLVVHNDAPATQGPRALAAEKNPLSEVGLNGQSSPLSTTPVVWQSGAQAIDRLFHDRLASLPTDVQLKKNGPPPDALERVHQIDKVVMWMLMIVGGLLIVGLFARLAAVVGALFLLSIICSQPPWLADSIPTYNQWVEFVAMLTLATLPVGRWGGLDYFLSRLFCRRCCAAEGNEV